MLFLAMLVVAGGTILLTAVATPRSPAVSTVFTFGLFCVLAAATSANLILRARPSRVYKSGLRAGSKAVVRR